MSRQIFEKQSVPSPVRDRALRQDPDSHRLPLQRGIAKATDSFSGQRRKIRTATPSTVRQVNRSIVLNLIRVYQTISRVDLSRRTGISRSNVSDIVDELLQQGYLTEEQAVPVGRGRVPLLISLNRRSHLVVGVS